MTVCGEWHHTSSSPRTAVSQMLSETGTLHHTQARLGLSPTRVGRVGDLGVWVVVLAALAAAMVMAEVAEVAAVVVLW